MTGRCQRRLSDHLAECGQFAKSRSIAAEKHQVLKSHVPYAPVKRGQAWRGSRHFRDNNTDFSISITGQDGSLIRGKVRSNRGRVEMEVSGFVEGNRIELETTSIVRGKPRWLRFSGCLFDERMVLWTRGITVSKKPASDYVMLRRK